MSSRLKGRAPLAHKRAVPRPFWRNLMFGLALVVHATALGGCMLYHAAAAPVKLAATTTVVAGKTATALVTNTGKVAVSAANAVGSLGSTSLDSAAQLTQAGMVTFVDASTGTIVRVPWQQGLTLASASNAAHVSFARGAVEIVRAGKLIYSASKAQNATTVPVASGDVVRIGG